jgi:hypothetical protein
LLSGSFRVVCALASVVRRCEDLGPETHLQSVRLSAQGLCSNNESYFLN